MVTESSSGALLRPSIALLQNESEMLNLPARDLSAFLEDRQAHGEWEWSLFTERSFEELLARPSRFDCVVMGYNAIHRGPRLQEALATTLLDTGLLILHQLDRRALASLQSDLALDLCRLKRNVRTVTTPPTLTQADEVLLSWPASIEVTASPASYPYEAHVALVASPHSAWRVVLQAEQDERRLPVLVRTSALRRPPVAVCSLLLEPGRPADADLLRNMITFCASGLPDVVCAPDLPAAPRLLLERKLMLSGAHVVTAGDSVDFTAWPARGASAVVVREGAVGNGEAAWLEAGGRLVKMKPEGRLHATHGSSDVRAVARRWAAVMGVKSPAEWVGGWSEGAQHPGSILATRAVLRVVRELSKSEMKRGLESEPDPLTAWLLDDDGLQRAVAALLRRRGVMRGHLDETVSTTVAALDLDALFEGRLLSERVRERLKVWLRDHFQGAADEDKVDIARVLPDERAFFTTVIEAFGESSGTVSPMVVTKLRDAAVACGNPAAQLRLCDRRRHTEELATSALVAASYLAALADFRKQFDEVKGGALWEEERRTVDIALRTLRRDGTLLRTTLKPSAEQVSTEALALLRCFATPDALAPDAPVELHLDAQVVYSGQVVPPVLVEGLLRETATLRLRNAELQVADHDLTVARNFCAGAAIVGAIVATAATAWTPRTAGDWVAIAGVVILIVLAFFAALARARLLPAWGHGVIDFVGEGVTGLYGRLREIAQRERPGVAERGPQR
jgi:hypothetical protein